MDFGTIDNNYTFDELEKVIGIRFINRIKQLHNKKQLLSNQVGLIIDYCTNLEEFNLVEIKRLIGT